LIIDDEPVIVSSIMIIIDCLTREIPGFVLDQRVDTAFDGDHAIEVV